MECLKTCDLIEKRQTEVELIEFKIISRNYNNSKWKRKVSEALSIKQYRLILHVQEQSIPLKLLN